MLIFLLLKSINIINVVISLGLHWFCLHRLGPEHFINYSISYTFYILQKYLKFAYNFIQIDISNFDFQNLQRKNTYFIITLVPTENLNGWGHVKSTYIILISEHCELYLLDAQFANYELQLFMSKLFSLL
jgi:hypothetical protein